MEDVHAEEPLHDRTPSPENADSYLGQPILLPDESQHSVTAAYAGVLLNYSMELVWHGEFRRLFQNFYPSQWYLSPTFTFPKGHKWMMYKDSAKVRFLCKVSSIW